ncbi:MAG: BACON domain-containing carbohydrate-binding protein [Rikenellaceae bacterium]
MKRLLLLLIAICSFAGCNKKTDPPLKSITVAEETELSQTINADQTTAESIKFTTTGAWHIFIVGSTTEWITMDPEFGDKAGANEINITCKPNDTGSDRTAEFRIIGYNNYSITFKILQKAKVVEES